MASPSAGSVKIDVDRDTPMRSDEESSHSDDNGTDSDEEEEQTEWLVTTREKRSTAGNRLSSLIQQAAVEDDDLELLFAEDEEDDGFEDVEDDASDVQMDSSDDDDDQGPTAAGVEELEGEKELQQQLRAEKVAKKRKANDGLPRAFRKRVKIDPTAPQIAPSRPKKKSERASWIPTPEEAPTRASARSTTKISKEQLHIQMVEREKRRLRQLAIMESSEKKKNAEKPKEITQEERLAEAARVEMNNAQSLNSWEEAERVREEERKAKLAALHNRKMQGPYITWWSGLAEWVGGKLKRVGKNITIEEKPKSTAGRKRKVDEMQEEVSVPSIMTPQDTQTSTNATSSTPVGPSEEPKPLDATQKATPLGASPLDITPLDTTSLGTTIATSIKDQVLDPVAEPALPIQSDTKPIEEVMAIDHNLVMLDVSQTQSTTIAQPPLDSASTVADASAPPPNSSQPRPTSPPSSSSIAQPPPLRMMPSQTTPFTFAPPQPPPAPEIPPVVEKGTYNCLILENFEETAIKVKDVQCQVLFNKKFTKAYKPSPVPCAITAYPAKFRDPATNLPYCNAYAYKEIQRLKRGEYKWSTLLQAYVGQSQYAARGVPARFIKPAAVDSRAHPVQSVRR